jgi:WD40-like Beta Propeller Repeat
MTDGGQSKEVFGRSTNNIYKSKRLLALAIRLGIGARVRSRAGAWLGVVAAVALGVVVVPASALAARGHVRSSLPAFGGPCTGAGGACEPGQVKEPFGAAVDEATGDVYVVDRAESRVDIFSSEGKPEGELTGPSAAGTATLTEGSAEIEALKASGAFTVGEEISGEGIPAGTTIEAVESLSVLEPLSMLRISQPVEAGKSGTFVPVTAKQQFAGPTAIAIDNSCEQHQPQPLPEPECAEADPSNGDVYVEAGFSEQAIDKFTATGEYVDQITERSIKNPEMEALASFDSGLAVDTHGRLHVLDAEFQDHGFGSARFEGIETFSDANENVWEAFVPESRQLSAEDGLATDATGHSYVRAGAIVAELGVKGEVLDEAVGGEVSSGVGFDGVAVEPATGDVYIDNVATVGRFGPLSGGTAPEVERFGAGALPEGACEPSGAGGEASCLGGIAVDSADGRVYVANPSGEVLQFVLEPHSSPSVASESASDVTDDSARLGAEINPRSLPGDSATSYRFEYGACSSPTTCATSPLEQRVPEEADGSLQASFETESVSELVQGLRAATTYHFVLVAENSFGAAEGVQEKIFTTRGTGAFKLPDGRQWQLVSQSDKHGALIKPIGREWPIEAAADGSAITYATDAPTESEPAGQTGLQQVLSTRTAAGWSTKDISIPYVQAPGVVSDGQEYRFFSEDLSQAALQPFGHFLVCRSPAGAEQPCLSSKASEQTAFLHTNYTPTGGFCTSSCFTPLVTGDEGDANVPPNTIFGVDEAGVSCQLSTQGICGPRFVDGTADLKHVLLKSTAPLTSDPVENGLYEWSAGSPPSEQLRLVSIPAESETGVRGDLGPSVDRIVNAMSPDGSRVVWNDGPHLYLRINATRPQSPIVGGACVQPADACTLQLDTGLSGESAFQLANTDVSRVFFTNEGDLYEYDVAGRVLHRITEGAEVQGLLSGASEDGSWVYFVANGVLGDGAEHGAVTGNCTLTGAAASHFCNMYVLHDGAIKLIAVLSAADEHDWGGSGTASLGDLTARVSPDGEWLAFMSQRSLTGYDNRDASSGQRDEEVFLYNASAGKLVCASCNPTGALPHGKNYGFRALPLVGGAEVWHESTWLAGNIPGWTPIAGGVSYHQSRYLSDSGRLFFNASDGLVPKDGNGQEDVYEFEPQGVGSCSGSEASSGSVAFSEAGDGCVGLLSSGGSEQESAFMDASESGDDVFILTAAQLVPQEDIDSAYDIYDVHVCPGGAPCAPVAGSVPPPCNTEASCKAAPTPQPELFGASGSATFSGPGNVTPSSSSPPAVKPKTAAQIRAAKLAKALKACQRVKSKKKRAACRKQAVRRYGPVKKARKATNDRRAGR